MEKLLFAFDLDGTLLNSRKEISPDTIKAIREMYEKGHVIVLASGRLGSSLMRYDTVLGIPFSTVTLNGAAAYNGGAGHSVPIFNLPLQKEFSSEIIKFYKENSVNSKGEMDFSLNFYCNNALYTEFKNKDSEWVKLYIKETASVYEFIDDLNYLRDKEPEKILLCGKEKILNDIEKTYRSKWGNNVYIVRTWDRYLEFLNKNVNKAVALGKIAANHGISNKNVIAFGDGDNDAPMLEMAGLGIAVKNGTSSVKEAADKISDFTNDEDVIAKEWELIKQRNY